MGKERSPKIKQPDNRFPTQPNLNACLYKVPYFIYYKSHLTTPNLRFYSLNRQPTDFADVFAKSYKEFQATLASVRSAPPNRLTILANFWTNYLYKTA